MEAAEHHFLKGFTPAARERLLASLIRKDYPDGAFLFQQGDPADGVYLVLNGHVEIVRVAGSQEKILDLIQPHDYFGEVAVLDGLGRSTAARARGAASIAKIPGDVLLDVLATGPGSLTLDLLNHVLSHLRKATDMLVREAIHREKLSLVGGMANSLMHDLRTPVTNIRLSADLINTDPAAAKVPQWCDGIGLQCDRLVAMAEELMEFSRGESRLALTRTTASAFFDQFKALNEGFLNPPGVEIVFKAEPVEVELDVMRMQRVLQNLVSNGIDALHGKAGARLEIEARVEKSSFLLSVTDNGPGIPLEIQGGIFEPFVTHGKTKGIGLGMAIVQNIVTAHGGTITFDTSPERGTTFLVRLPQEITA